MVIVWKYNQIRHVNMIKLYHLVYVHLNKLLNVFMIKIHINVVRCVDQMIQRELKQHVNKVHMDVNGKIMIVYLIHYHNVVKLDKIK